MRLNALHLVNFRQHSDTRIEFDSGLTGIIGPNGSGKTTILEAIAWAIYGNPAARGTRDTIRHVRAGARAAVRVELDFDLAGHRYRICRGLTSAELYLDGSGVPIASSISGVTELVTRRLGMSRDEFFNTYFTGQKELSVMAAMGPSERAQFLSHVLGYERLRSAQQLLRDRRSTIVAELGGLRQGMPDPVSVREALSDAHRRLSDAVGRAARISAERVRAQEAVDAVRPRWESAQRERERQQELLSELRVTEQESLALDRDRDRIERELREITVAKADRTELERELVSFAALREEFARLETLARGEVRRQALLDTCRSLEEELERLRARSTLLKGAPQLEREVDAQLAAARAELAALDLTLQARRTDWVRDRQEAETKRQTLRNQYSELKHQRDKLANTGEEEPCPTCLRPLGESLKSVLDLFDSQIETVRVDGNYYKRRVEQLQETPEDLRVLEDSRRERAAGLTALERRLVKVQVSVQELGQLAIEIAAKESRHDALRGEIEAIPAGYDGNRHTAVRAAIERLGPIYARVERLGVQIEREPLLLEERVAVFEGIGSVQLRLADLREARELGEMSEAEFAGLHKAFEHATEELRAAQLSAVSADGETGAARAAVESAERVAGELAERQRLLGELQQQKRLHDELDRAYTDLRTDLNFQLRPELSELASGFLSELTEGRYAELELDDHYNIVVLEDSVPKPVISGGEEDLANLVLRLAISQMIAERAGQPFSLLVLDEIFGSLDEMRRANVLELLRRLQDRFEQVILITHIESVRDGLDHVITVRYDEERGASVVEQGTEQTELVVLTGSDAEGVTEEATAGGVEPWR